MFCVIIQPSRGKVVYFLEIALFWKCFPFALWASLLLAGSMRKMTFILLV